MSGYTVTLSASIDDETGLDLHLYFTDKRLAEFVMDESCDWGEFRRNLFLNKVVNRIWNDKSSKFESPNVKGYVKKHIINGDWGGFELDTIKKTPQVSDTRVTITGDTVNMYTAPNTDEYQILEVSCHDVDDIEASEWLWS